MKMFCLYKLYKLACYLNTFLLSIGILHFFTKFKNDICNFNHRLLMRLGLGEAGHLTALSLRFYGHFCPRIGAEVREYRNFTRKTKMQGFLYNSSKNIEKIVWVKKSQSTIFSIGRYHF